MERDFDRNPAGVAEAVQVGGQVAQVGVIGGGHLAVIVPGIEQARAHGDQVGGQDEIVVGELRF